MHDIAMIRQEPEAFDAGLARRGAEPVTAKLLDLDSRRRAVLTELQVIARLSRQAVAIVWVDKIQNRRKSTMRVVLK